MVRGEVIVWIYDWGESRDDLIAYEIYTELCRVQGIEPKPYETKKSAPSNLGSFELTENRYRAEHGLL
jgi:hypothetical protein